MLSPPPLCSAIQPPPLRFSLSLSLPPFGGPQEKGKRVPFFTIRPSALNSKKEMNKNHHTNTCRPPKEKKAKKKKLNSFPMILFETNPPFFFRAAGEMIERKRANESKSERALARASFSFLSETTNNERVEGGKEREPVALKKNKQGRLRAFLFSPPPRNPPKTASPPPAFLSFQV